jgi:inhibitor of cysteine peptidase
MLERWSVTIVMNDSKIHAIMIVSIILSLAVVAAFTPEYQANAETRLKSFTSYDELKNFVSKSTQYQGWYPYGGSRQTWGLSPLTFMESTQVSSVPDYSLTNVQVEGVDEADIVKTDGTYIYIISNQSIVILKAYPPEEAQILSRIKFEGGIRGVFINQDKLVVFEDIGYYYDYYGYYKPTAEPADYQGPKTSIRIYSIADRANPTSVRNVSVGGNYFSSRMIGNYAYVVVNQPALTYQGNVTIPVICYADRTEPVPASEIFYANITDNFNTYVNVLAINILDDHEAPNEKSYLIGYASTMYVSQNNIYITYSTYNDQIQGTKVHRISISEGEIVYQASGEVPGYVLNQFSMDEFNGYFRIATTEGEVWATGESTSRNNVYILDMELDTVGMLEDLAPGEKIHSARFMGNRCYLVTFKKIDPLFVIDLTIPTNPTVLGQLKITGYSDYLHPYDENHIIGIGKETIEAEEGNFAWYQGVKISLFDVTDVAVPKEIAKYEIGDRGTDSPILYDHKAFLFDKERSLLVIPVTVAEINPDKYPGGVPTSMYGDFVWDGAYVFRISLEEGLEFRGGITHLPDNSELMKSGYYYHSAYSVKRSLYIDNILYTISELKIKMNSLADLSEIGEINLSP